MHTVTKTGRCVVVAVGGVTCGGKSTLAARLAANRGAPAHVLSQDEYFLPEDDERHQSVPGLGANNWDVLEALDLPRLADDLRTLVTSLNDQHGGTVLVIVEGHLVLNCEAVRQQCDVMFYVTLSRDVCWQRRRLRTYEPPDVDGYFEQCVWPMHEHYKRQLERVVLEQQLRVEFLDGTAPLDQLESQILARVRREMARLSGEELSAEAS